MLSLSTDGEKRNTQPRSTLPSTPLKRGRGANEKHMCSPQGLRLSKAVRPATGLAHSVSSPHRDSTGEKPTCSSSPVIGGKLQDRLKGNKHGLKRQSRLERHRQIWQGCEAMMIEMLRVLMANTDSVQIIDKQHRQRDRKAEKTRI